MVARIMTASYIIFLSCKGCKKNATAGYRIRGADRSPLQLNLVVVSKMNIRDVVGFTMDVHITWR